MSKSTRWSRLAMAVLALVVAAALGGCGGDGGDDGAGDNGERTRVRHLGFLSVSASPPFIAALKEGLQELGYVEGKNLRLDVRTTVDEAEVPNLAAELVAAKVEVLIVGGTVAAEAAKKATTTIPIVMTNSGDPVETGLVESMVRPGGNITGLTQNSPQLGPKRLELLKEAFPGTTKVALLVYTGHPTTRLAAEKLRTAAPELGIEVFSAEMDDEAGIVGALARAKGEGAGAVIVLRNPFTVRVAKAIAAAAAAAELPAMYETRNFIDDGGLMLYGPSFAELYKRSAGYVDKILEGADPATMPIGAPTEFELVINTKAEAALGVQIAESVRLRADELVD